MAIVRNILECYAGTSVRVTGKDMENYVEAAITSGATVSIWIYDLSGNIVVGPVAGSATAIDGDGVTDDWAATLTAPSNAGNYEIRFQAVHADGTARAKAPLKVLAW